MPAPVRLFLETTYHPGFRYGGWGVARDVAGVVTGQAGGERNTTASRLDLMALIAALDGLPPGPVEVHSASAGLIGAARILAAPPGADSPSDDLDLWAKALKLAQGRVLAVKPAAKAPGAPSAFLAAWAEVGQDKAKAKGLFSAAIPKPNLAKLVLP